MLSCGNWTSLAAASRNNTVHRNRQKAVTLINGGNESSTQIAESTEITRKTTERVKQSLAKSDKVTLEKCWLSLNAKEAHVLLILTEEKMFADRLLFSSQRGLVANADVLKFIVAKSGSDAHWNKEAWRKLTSRNKNSFLCWFLVAFFFSHSHSESRMSKTLLRFSSEIYDKNLSKLLCSILSAGLGMRPESAFRGRLGAASLTSTITQNTIQSNTRFLGSVN